MKKILFFAIAISMLSSTASFAGGGKKDKKAHTKTVCPKGCPKSSTCH